LLIAGLRDLLIGPRFIDFFLFFAGIRASNTSQYPKIRKSAISFAFYHKTPQHATNSLFLLIWK